LLFRVFVLLAGLLAGVVHNESAGLAVLALALEFLGGFILAGLELAADLLYLLLGALEFLAGGCLLAAAGGVGGFEAGVVVLVVGVLFVAGPIALLVLLLRVGVVRDATLLHLVLIAVLVLVEPFPKLLLPLLLDVSNPIFIQ
jgi:hypothetical protein